MPARAQFRALATELERFKGRSAQQDEVQRSFNYHDRDGNGKIDVKELEMALAHLGMPTDTNRAAKIMVKYDVDNSGGLELKEFRQLVGDLRYFQAKDGAEDDGQEAA